MASGVGRWWNCMQSPTAPCAVATCKDKFHRHERGARFVRPPAWACRGPVVCANLHFSANPGGLRLTKKIPIGRAQGRISHAGSEWQSVLSGNDDLEIIDRKAVIEACGIKCCWRRNGRREHRPAQSFRRAAMGGVFAKHRGATEPSIAWMVRPQESCWLSLLSRQSVKDRRIQKAGRLRGERYRRLQSQD